MRPPLEEEQQCTFKPNIGDKLNRSRTRDNLFSYLYTHHTLCSHMKTSNSPQPRIEDRKPKIYKQTNYYYNTLRYKIFTTIFQILDQDRDGIISSNSINIKYVHPQILAIIKPILVQMDEQEKELTEEDFIYLCDDLYRKLTPIEKNVLLKSKNRNKLIRS